MHAVLALVVVATPPPACLHTLTHSLSTFLRRTQEYTMTCLLCGRAADCINIEPVDPRKARFF